MTQRSDSLGGKNNRGRPSGARSSRARSTIFKKLRALDRKITELDRFAWLSSWNKQMASEHRDKRGKLDQQRKQIRLQRKEYTLHP